MDNQYSIKLVWVETKLSVAERNWFDTFGLSSLHCVISSSHRRGRMDLLVSFSKGLMDSSWVPGVHCAGLSPSGLWALGTVWIWADWETLEMKLSRESGSCVLTAHSNLRDPDVLALGHWNVEVCLETELLREKKWAQNSLEKEVLYLEMLPEGILGFVLMSLSVLIKWSAESLDHHLRVCSMVLGRPWEADARLAEPS